MNWYLVEVKKGKEEALKEVLDQYDSLRVYYPRVQKHIRIHGEDSYGERALASGCVLLETELTIKEVSSTLLKHPAYSICSFALLSDDMVTLLKRFCQDDWLMKMSKGVIVDGVTKVKEGPLVGEESHIMKINRHKRFCQLDYELNHQCILVGLEITEKR